MIVLKNILYHTCLLMKQKRPRKISGALVFTGGEYRGRTDDLLHAMRNYPLFHYFSILS